jgi:hypothetical protein
VSDREEYQGAKLPRPGQILVHDFAVTSTDLPAWSEAYTRFTGFRASQTAEEIEIGRRLGARISKELAEEIGGMGLPATVHVDGRTEPRVGDLILVGYLTSVDEGSALKRMVLGFGSGSAEIRTHVEGYRMTESGFQKLGSGDTDSSGGKTPGVILPVIVTVATSNPIGIIVSLPAKGAGELTGRSTIEGTAKRTANKIAEVLQEKFKEQGWLK